MDAWRRAVDVIRAGDDGEMIRHLLEHGLGASERAALPRTGVEPLPMPLLNLAAANLRHAIAVVLLEYGADPNVEDETGNTPLMWAVELFDAALVKLLLDGGGDPNLVTSVGSSLHVFAEVGAQHARLLFRAQGDVGMLLTVLRSYGADLEVRHDGRTALHRAVECDCVGAAWALLEAGALARARDLGGRTPLHALFEARPDHLVNLRAKTALLDALSARGATLADADDAGETVAELASRNGWLVGARGVRLVRV